ncbi:MAG: flippase-like domain-containing protein [Candidatus Omnitrophica bacterium]|nr:flippase-like domain-containing protein [Candidatus Omnitrophota bacterium]
MKTNSRDIIIRISISLGAVFLLLYFLRDKLSESINILRQDVDWRWMIVAISLHLTALSILAVRLRLVFKVQKIFVTFGESFYLGIVALFFNLFLPSAVGGDLAKAYYAYKHSGKKMEATTSVILDRLMGFIALILMALTALLISHSDIHDARIDHLVYFALALMILTILFFGSKRFARIFTFLSILIPSEKWKSRLAAIYHAIHNYRHHRGILALSISLSFIAQFCFVLIHYCLAIALGVHTSPSIFFILVPLVAIISMAPSIGGLGVREAGVTYLFSRIMPTERALALSLLLDALLYGFSFASGIIYTMRGSLKTKEFREMEAIE